MQSFAPSRHHLLSPRDWGQAVLSPFPFADNLAIAEGDKAEGNQAARALLLSGKAQHISGRSWISPGCPAPQGQGHRGAGLGRTLSALPRGTFNVSITKIGYLFSFL